MTDYEVPNLDALPADELLAVARHAVMLLVDQLSEPSAVHDFEPLTHRDPASDWGAMLAESPRESPMESHTESPSVPGEPAPPHPRSLPCLHRRSEELGRAVGSLLTVLAGHTDRLFEQTDQRTELLGIPAGRSAYRDTPDYLREHLDISRSEGRRRISRAHHLMPRTAEVTGARVEPSMPVLADAVRAADVGMPAVDLVTSTLTDARREAVLAGVDWDVVADLIEGGERLLTEQATALDPDSLRKVCARWTQWAEAMINPDGSAPTDSQKNHHQGLFYQGRRLGLHQWILNADELQHEVLSTVAHAAANPRSSRSAPDGDSGDAAQTGDDSAGPDGTTEPPSPSDDTDAIEAIDDRTRAQRQLDGVVAALNGALAMVEGNGLPDAGGVRPQVLVTIDYRQLLNDLGGTLSAGCDDGMDESARSDENDGSPQPTGHGSASDGAPPGHGPPSGAPPPAWSPSWPDGPLESGWYPASEAAFGGPISPTTIRTIACDAALVPVVLGGDGDVLDLGRSQRLFTPRLRRAIIARDGGCAAPGCTMPAPWCSVHHVQEWERGGPTSVDNGALLCSHHHSAVHAGAWSIDMRSGCPWFIPAPYLDPARKPRRNRYWRPR